MRLLFIRDTLEVWRFEVCSYTNRFGKRLRVSVDGTYLCERATPNAQVYDKRRSRFFIYQNVWSCSPYRPKSWLTHKECNFYTMTIYIGRLIEAELHRQERSVTWFAEKLCCDRTNVYSIFKRESIDTALLLRISKVLHYNFFRYYMKAMADCDFSST